MQPLFPEYPYVPGRTPRHPEGWFDAIRDTVRPGATARELADSPAWAAGLAYLEDGFFWEAHEVLEPVWMALPHGSREREMVQALIQLANACLKREMGRPRAVLRLCRMVAGHLQRPQRTTPCGFHPFFQSTLLGCTIGRNSSETKK